MIQNERIVTHPYWPLYRRAEIKFACYCFCINNKHFIMKLNSKNSLIVKSEVSSYVIKFIYYLLIEIIWKTKNRNFEDAFLWFYGNGLQP